MFSPAYMKDQAIFRRIMLRFQRTKQRLLRTQNLNRTRGGLRQAQQAARMRDEPRAHELAHQGSQVRRDGVHPVPEVLVQLRPVLGDGDYLVAELVDVIDVGVSDFRAHADLGGDFEGGFKLFGKDVGKGGGGGVGAEAYIAQVSVVFRDASI